MKHKQQENDIDELIFHIEKATHIATKMKIEFLVYILGMARLQLDEHIKGQEDAKGESHQT